MQAGGDRKETPNPRLRVQPYFNLLEYNYFIFNLKPRLIPQSVTNLTLSRPVSCKLTQ